MEKIVKKCISILFLGVALQSAMGVYAMDINDEDTKSEVEQEEWTVAIEWATLAEKKARLTEEERERLDELLILAVDKGDIQAAIKALEEGANVNTTMGRSSDGDHALITAASYNNKDMVVLLISYGAHVNYQAGRARSALAFATISKFKDAEIVRLLVFAGATPEESDLAGSLQNYPSLPLSKEMELLIEETREERKQALKNIVFYKKIKEDRVCDEFLEFIPQLGDIISDYVIPYYENKLLNKLVAHEMART